MKSTFYAGQGKHPSINHILKTTFQQQQQFHIICDWYNNKLRTTKLTNIKATWSETQAGLHFAGPSEEADELESLSISDEFESFSPSLSDDTSAWSGTAVSSDDLNWSLFASTATELESTGATFSTIIVPRPLPVELLVRDRSRDGGQELLGEFAWISGLIFPKEFKRTTLAFGSSKYFFARTNNL